MFPRNQSIEPGDPRAYLVQDISTRSLQSVRVGENAGKISTGIGNSYLGFGAGQQSTDTQYGTYMGYLAGQNNANSTYSTMIGALSGAQSSRTTESTFVGYSSGELAIDATQLVAVGAYALRENRSGNRTVAVGYRAGERCLDGYQNCLLGTESGQDNRSGANNCAIGFQSGRSFHGNENTYVGALSGYSNDGTGNTLVGFSSGANLTFGSYNVAIGAYSLQDTFYGDCNVVIGTFARGSSSSNSDANVILGSFVATNADLSESVVAGTYAAQNVKGHGNVLLGYRVCPRLEYSDSNVMIGTGADSYDPNCINAISIGSISTFTFSNAISLGNFITNQRERSILVGYDLFSDADNSIIVGNTISIDSVIFFRDPISDVFKNTVAIDGIAKIGLCNIDYSQTLISPCNEIYPYAIAGVYASNIKATQPVDFIEATYPGPTSYDLTEIGSNIILHHGHTFIIQNIHDLASNILASDVILYSSSNLSFTHPIYPIDASNLLYQPNSNLPLSWDRNAITNFVQFDQTSSSIPISLCASVARIVCSQSDISWNIDPLQGPSYITSLPTLSLSNVGIPITAETRLIVTTPPQYGTVDLTSPSTIQYTRYTEYQWIQPNDTVILQPVLQITTDDGQVYGIPADTTITYHIQPEPIQRIISSDTIWLHHGSCNLSSNELLTQPSLPSETPLLFLSMDSNLLLHSNQTIFTSNDIAIMRYEQVELYSNEAYPMYLRGVSNVLESAIAETILYYQNNIGIYLQQFDLQAENLSNELYLASIIDPAPYTDLQILRFEASNLNHNGENGVATSTAFDALYTNVTTWSNLYDDSYTSTPNLFTNLNQWNLYYTNEEYGPFFVATSNLRPVFLSNPQQIRIGLSNYHDTLSTYTLTTSLTLPQTIYPSYQILYHKYFEIPRMFPTIDDWYKGRLRITTTNSNLFEFTNPLAIQMLNENYQWNVRNDLTTSTTWITPSLLSIPARSWSNERYQSIPLSLTFGAAKATDWYIATPPKDGILLRHSPSNLSYSPWNPFASNDHFHIVIQNEKQETIDVPIDISYHFNETIRTIPSTFPMLPPESQISISEIPLSNVNYTKTLSNILIIHKTWDSNIEIQSELIPVYNPLQGYLVQTSNLDLQPLSLTITPLPSSTSPSTFDIQSNIAITTLFSNIRDPIPYTSNDYAFMVFDPTIYDPIETGWASNLIIEDRRYVNIEVQYEMDSNITTILQSQTITLHCNLLPTNIASKYIYTQTDPIVELTFPIQRILLSEPTANPTVINTFVRAQSNITLAQTYHPITNHHIQLRSVNTVPISMPAPFEIIRSNIGPTNSYDINEIQYLRGPSTACNLSATIGTQSWSISTASLSNWNMNTMAPVSWNLNAATARSPLYPLSYLFPPPSSPSNIMHLYSSQRSSWSFSNGYTHSAYLHQLSNIEYVPWGRYDDDTITMFFTDHTNQNVISDIYRIPLTLHHSVVPYPLSFNRGISVVPQTYLSSNLFYAPSNHLLRITLPDNMSLYLDATIVDPDLAGRYVIPTDAIAQERVEMTFQESFFTPSNVIYDIERMDNTPIETNKIFQVRTYEHQAYPHPLHIADTQLQRISLGFDETVELRHNGSLWSSWIEQWNIQGVPVTNVEFHHPLPLRYGWLTHPSLGSSNQITSFSYNDILSQDIDYISTLSNIYNENPVYRLRVGNTVSSLYTIPLKNYISHFTSYGIETSSISIEHRSLRSPPRPASFIEDGITWSAPSNVLAMYSQSPMSDVATPWTLSNLNNTRTWSVARYAMTRGATWNQTHISKEIDQADQFSLASYLSYQYDVNHVPQVWFHVATAPLHGIIFDTQTEQVVTLFTKDHLQQNRIVYQHRGSLVSTDEFRIAIATTPYDLSDFCTFSLTIRPLPLLTSVALEYLYMDNVATITNKPFPFAACNLAFSDSGGSGYLHPVDSHYLTLYPNAPIPLASLYSSNMNYFKIDTSILSNVTPYPIATLEFTLNNHSEPYVHPIASYTPYQHLFLHEYRARLNHNIDRNIITAEIPPLQEIVYTLDTSSVATQSLKRREIQIGFEVQRKPSYQNAQYRGSAREKFSIHIDDEAGAPLLRIDFVDQNAIFTWAEGTVTKSLPSTLDDLNWYPIYLRLDDPRNLGYLSVYWKNTYTNLLNNEIPSFDESKMHTIRIFAPITTAPNLITGDFSVSLNPSVYASFELENSYQSYLFRNFEMSVSTYDIVASTEQAYDPNTHNIVLGKDIAVRGTNNICFGNRFITSGQRSIIIGNDIGRTEVTQEGGTVNDVFQAIIIGNQSFANSIIRDIICIGNNIMNNLSLQNVTDVQLFLAKKPILVGNDISASNMDFHINVGNSFLKTSVGGDQIYLGQNRETVGIGYSSNAQLDARAILHINGCICAQNINMQHLQRTYISLQDIPLHHVVVASSVVGEDVTLPTMANDPCVMGVCVRSALNSQNTYDIDVCISGKTQVLAARAMSRGELLVTHGTLPGYVDGLGSATALHSYTFARAISTGIATGSNYIVPCLWNIGA